MLRIGLFYVEMNMVKIFFVLNLDVMVCDFVKEMGFIFDVVLKYVKSVINYYYVMIIVEIF